VKTIQYDPIINRADNPVHYKSYMDNNQTTHSGQNQHTYFIYLIISIIAQLNNSKRLHESLYIRWVSSPNTYKGNWSINEPWTIESDLKMVETLVSVNSSFVCVTFPCASRIVYIWSGDTTSDTLADRQNSIDSPCWENESSNCFCAFSAITSFWEDVWGLAVVSV